MNIFFKMHVILRSTKPTNCLLNNFGRLRHLSTQQKISEDEPDQKPTKSTAKKDTPHVPKKKKGVSKEINEYLASTEDLKRIKSKIPLKYLKRTRKVSDDMCLVDASVAKNIASHIAPSLLKSKSNIIESGPGFGFITENLLNAGVGNIRLYESDPVYQENVIKLNQSYPGRLQIFNKDFFSIWRLTYQDRHDNGNRMHSMLTGIEPRKWEEDPVMIILGTLPSTNFIRHCMLSLIFQYGIMTYGRCEMYLSIPPSIYLQLTAGPESGYTMYRASSVLFQALCDFELLTKSSRQAFFPWEAKKTKKYSRLPVTDLEYLYLTRITFKRDLPVPMEKLQSLWHFICYMMLIRKNRIVPNLEKWIPGCGTRLLMKKDDINYNINIFTQIGELNAAQIICLFKTFSSWPEYAESTFIPSMESAILKMESSADLTNTTTIEIDDGKEDSTEDKSGKNPQEIRQ